MHNHETPYSRKMNTVNLEHMSVAELMAEMPDSGTWTFTDDVDPRISITMDGRKFKAFAESHERLLAIAKKISATMGDSPTAMNYKFSLQTAIELADKLDND
jgi:predicted transcriptional regulator